MFKLAVAPGGLLAELSEIVACAQARPGDSSSRVNTIANKKNFNKELQHVSRIVVVPIQLIDPGNFAMQLGRGLLGRETSLTQY